jgi:hypothetical protein
MPQQSLTLEWVVRTLDDADDHCFCPAFKVVAGGPCSALPILYTQMSVKIKQLMPQST